MSKFDTYIEDFRIYFSIGASCACVWILLPALRSVISADALVALNLWSQVGGQLIIAGVLLPGIPRSLRFLFVLAFTWYFISFLGSSLDLECSLAMDRFKFSPGEMPSCLFSKAI